MSVRLHRIRCSACSGFGVHDGWNTHVKPTALSPVAKTDTKLLIYDLFQKGRVLAQDAIG